MILGLTLDATVRAASGLLFLALGLFVLLVGRSRPGNAMLGVHLAVFGAVFVFQNLITGETPPIFGMDPLVFEDVGSLALYAVLIASLAGVVLASPRNLSSRWRRRALASSAIVGAIGGSVGFAMARGTDTTIVLAADAVYQAWLTMLLVWIVGLVRVLPKLDGNDQRAAGLLALGFSMYPAYVAAYNLAPLRWEGLDLVDRATYGSAVALVGAIVVLWLRSSTRGGASRLARNAALALAAVSLAGLALSPLVAPEMPDTTGGIGVARVLGAACIAWAVLRHDLLGVGLRGRTIRRGTVATGALAALLIVAQVAQNFLAAQYGLLMGGVVAGSLIFAASPLQRAIEARGNGNATPTTTPTGDDRASELYRATLRRYLRDGTLSREEERHLAHLAGELRIDAGHAFEMREEIERETGVRR